MANVLMFCTSYSPVFYSRKVEINSSTKHAHSSAGTLMYIIRALGSDLVEAKSEQERDNLRVDASAPTKQKPSHCR